MTKTPNQEFHEAKTERDQARRMACEFEAKYNSLKFDGIKLTSPRDIAKMRGWDCYETQDREFAALDEMEN